MNRSNVVKVVGAFVAGVLVTIGSLIYSRSQELDRFRKAVQASPPLRTAPRAVSDTSSSETPNVGLQNGSPFDMPVHTVKPTREKARPIQGPKRVVPTQVGKTNEPAQLRSQIAQNTPTSNVAVPVASTISSAAKSTPPRSIAVPAQTQLTNIAEPTAARRKANVVTLQPGTNLTIRLQQSVSTDRNRTGDKFLGTVDSPLIVNGFVLADRGATVSGQITKIKRARLLGGKSDLGLILTEITLTDGQRLRVETSPWEEKSAHNSIVDTPRIAAGAAVGAVVGALTGAAKGAGLVSGNAGGAGTGISSPANNRNLVLTTGARLTFQLARPVTITERLDYR